MRCGHKYTPNPKHHGYPESLRKRAAEMYVDGGNLRRIARHLKVSPQTVSLWVTDVAEALPDAPVPQQVQAARLRHSDVGDYEIEDMLLQFLLRGGDTICSLDSVAGIAKADVEHFTDGGFVIHNQQVRHGSVLFN